VSLISQGNYALAMNLLEEFLTEYPGNSYALKEYAKMKNKDLNKLAMYARKMNIEKRHI